MKKKLIIALVIVLGVCALAMCGEHNANAASYCLDLISNFQPALL